MTQLASGEIHARKDGQNIFLAVGEGFVQVTRQQVSILTDMAIKAEDIDEAKAEEARQKAVARLSQKLSQEETASVQASLMQAMAQLTLKQRTRK